MIWRKKKGGLGMFKKYSAQTMKERDTTVDEWAKSMMATSSS
jgi:hypothetical protein